MRKIILLILIGCIICSALLFSPIPTQGSTVETGYIYGHTYQIIGWEIQPIPYARVSSEGHTTISNLVGYYRLSNLSLNHQYNVTASKCFYKSDSAWVVLTRNQPQKEVDFLLTFGDAIISDFSKIDPSLQSSLFTQLEMLSLCSKNVADFY